MLRNKEIRQFFAIFLFFTAMMALIGFFVFGKAGWLVLIAAVGYGILFWSFTRMRYENIARISEQIDQVLHNAEQLYVQEFEEGELSILESEITKMVVRIREQNEALKKEKSSLADSLADIAHQLRTPLTSANLVITLLRSETEERKRRELLREMEQLFVQMDWLITSLLKLSRLDAGIVVFRKEKVTVKNLLDLAVSPLLISLDIHAISLKMEVPDEAVITGDEAWLSEALRNIIKNCMESAGDNGRIEIMCEDTVLYTEISIHDSGIGFSKEDLHGLFERFYRGKDTKTSGYGIGMSLCKNIIMRQGGTVTAKNHPEGGAVFLIRFPK